MSEDIKGFGAGCIAGGVGLILTHPIDTVRVRMQTQGPREKPHSICGSIKAILKKEKARGLFKGLASPLVGQSAINAVVFGVESLVYRRVKNDGDQTLSIHKSVFAGFCAGAVQSVIVCPMELIKIRMQNQFIGRLPQHSNSKLLRFKNPSHDETKKKIKTMNTKIETIKKKMNEAIIKKVHRIHYSGPLEIAQNIVKTEGIKGMFRGWWITLLREVPQFGIYFGTYAWMRQYFATINNISPEDLGLLHLSLAGGVTGVVTWCWYPVDVIKSRLQYNGVIGGGNYNGIADCVRRSYQSEGISVFMKGFQPTIIRGALNGFVTLPVFTVVMQFLHSQYV